MTPLGWLCLCCAFVCSTHAVWLTVYQSRGWLAAAWIMAAFILVIGAIAP